MTIGADLSSLEQVQAIARSTGELAVTTASDAGQAATRMSGEVDDVTAALTTDFDATMTELVGIADQADQQIASGEWSGNAREQAVLAAGDFRAAITRMDADTATAVETFNTQLLDATASLTDTLTVRFTNVMNQAEAALTQFATAVATYGADLTAADNSVRYG